MNQEQEERFEMAEERLTAARILLENDSNVDSVSRVYYAMYHAAKALLKQKGSDPKTHSGISSELGKLFREEVGKKLTREFSRIQEKRERADYGEMKHIAKEEVQKDLETAETFIRRAREIVE
ncbi:MAG: HEPN domain-containing protein [Candidatus Nanohaloarchaea archaeon]